LSLQSAPGPDQHGQWIQDGSGINSYGFASTHRHSLAPASSTQYMSSDMQSGETGPQSTRPPPSLPPRFQAQTPAPIHGQDAIGPSETPLAYNDRTYNPAPTFIGNSHVVPAEYHEMPAESVPYRHT
jgi:hypothetical protein